MGNNIVIHNKHFSDFLHLGISFWPITAIIIIGCVILSF